MTASEARRTLPQQLDRVEAGEHVAITRHGRTVAVLVSPERARTPRTAALWEQADRYREMLESDRAAAKERPFEPVSFGEGRADELVKSIRRDRDSRE